MNAPLDDSQPVTRARSPRGEETQGHPDPVGAGSDELDWVIVGGGPHGVHLAVCLLGAGRVDPARLRIVDPAPRLLERWRACTAVTGMDYLRSSSVQHLDEDPFSLRRFVRRHAARSSAPYAAPYDRPALDLFDAHCDHVIEAFGLEDLHLRGRVDAVQAGRQGVTLDLQGGARLSSRSIVLAMGASEQPRWPGWAPREHQRVHHVFAPGFDAWPTSDVDTVGVVGGGVSAAQVAIRLARSGHRVRLVSRHPLREHGFDSDPGWLGPKRMAGFRRTRDPVRRREIITGSRHRGSVPRDVRLALQRLIDQGSVTRHEADVTALDERGGCLVARLSTGDDVTCEHVLLATGFTTSRPGGAMLDALVDSAGLGCAPCGFPLVDAGLRWHPSVHVTGPLAELELGPVSRTLAGARRAGERIVATARV